MPTVQPPPTWADPVLIDEATGKGKFNPVWLRWFVDLVGIINEGGGTSLSHNTLDGLQGGSVSERYHLTSAQQGTVAGLPTLAHGTYTPTLTNVTNLDGSTTYEAQYLRVGNTVVVSGKVDADPTAAGAVQLGISLPIASNLGAVEDCSGAAAAPGIAGQSAAIMGDAGNNRAEMQWVAVDTTNRAMHYVFAYQVI